jgi:hypothetical protein
MLGIQLSLDSTDYGLRTTDYGLLSVRRSWEVLGSPILIVYRGSRTRSVEYDQVDQSSHSLLLSIYLLLYATTLIRQFPNHISLSFLSFRFLYIRLPIHCFSPATRLRLATLSEPLQTLRKVLELVIAECISFVVKTYSLLLENHFRARKQRSIEQALIVL